MMFEKGMKEAFNAFYCLNLIYLVAAIAALHPRIRGILARECRLAPRFLSISVDLICVQILLWNSMFMSAGIFLLASFIQDTALELAVEERTKRFLDRF